MRRKSLLMVLVLCFLAGGVLSYQVLQSKTPHQPQYISISEWGTSPTVEIPHTGLEVTSESQPVETNAYSVLSPQAVATLVSPTPVTEVSHSANDTSSEPSDDSNNSSSTAETTSSNSISAETPPATLAPTTSNNRPDTNQAQTFVHTLAYNFMLVMAGLIILGLLAYFVYWHYYR